MVLGSNAPTGCRVIYFLMTVPQALPQDDPRQRQPDITLAKQVLEWAPTVPLQEGLQKTIDYFDDLLRDVIDKYNSRWEMLNVKVVTINDSIKSVGPHPETQPSTLMPPA